MVNLKMISLKYCVVLGVLSFLFVSCEQEKTAYVNNTELIQAYEKMKDAKNEFESRNEKLSKEFDSVAMNFQMQIQSYQENIGGMKLSEREQEEERLIALRKKIENDQRQKSIKLEDESASAADELVKEVRKKVEKYGEENNYIYIFGSNESANIMYAKRGKDITLEVIEYVNQ